MIPRLRMGPASRVSLGLCSLMIACLLLFDFAFGLMPDYDALLRQLRQRISEQVATQVAATMGSGDQRSLHGTLQTVARDAELISVAVRGKDGAIIAQAGPHAMHWTAPAAGLSDMDHVRVPLILKDQRWGDVEINFQPSRPRSAVDWLRQPRVFLLLVIGIGGFLLFTLYLRRVFHYLDPSAVIPDRVRVAFDGFSEGVMVVDAAGRIVLANTALRRWVERAGTTLHGQSLDSLPWLRSSLPQEPRDYPWMRAMTLNATQKGDQLDFPQESGDVIKTIVNCSPIQEGTSKVRGCIVTFDDVSELEKINTQLRATMADLERSREQIEKQNEELRHLAMRDPLTGCMNRRAFHERMDTLFMTARNDKQPLCCIMSDIDYFKSINDTYGHAVGDRVLQVVARALSGCLRDTDLLGRYGGEEFCIALPGIDLDEACAIAERLRAEIESRAGKGVRTKAGLSVTSSFGVSILEATTADPAQLIDQADKALYRAKAAGRNRVVNSRQAAAPDSTAEAAPAAAQ